jgi:predicted nucleic acid-binding protein
LFSDLIKDGRLGAGECSAIACAVQRGFILVIDDIRATKKAKKISPDLEIINTFIIMLELIKANAVDKEEAENIRKEWKSKHKFDIRAFELNNI